MKISSSTTVTLLLLSLARVIDITIAQRTTVNGGRIDLTTCVNQESSFDIQLVYMGTGQVNPVYEEAFELAAKRWSKVIVGDEPDIGANIVDDWFGGQFPGQQQQQPYNGAVDDLVIGYDIPDTIDGLGGTLGGAGPVFTRRDRLNRPLSTISGIMFFDGLDLDNMPLRKGEVLYSKILYLFKGIHNF